MRLLKLVLAVGGSAVVALAPASAQLAGEEIHIGVGGPLTTGAATFGVEMRQAVELAIAEKNAAGGILGARVVADAVDDGADTRTGEAAAQHFCDDRADLAVVGHVNSGVTIAASKVYAKCALVMLTPMSSSPGVTANGLTNVFRLTGRDDRKGPGLAGYLRAMNKRRAVVVDDQTPYGKGLADAFTNGFTEAGGAVAKRAGVKVGDTDFSGLLGALPADFDVLFFAGLREGALILRQMRERGMNQLFACGDGCWDVQGFIVPAQGAATKGEGVRILSAAPSLGKVPGSTDFGERYAAKYGPINNYAASSYDSARIVMAAIEAAAAAKSAMPSREDVRRAMQMTFRGIAYTRPVEWNANGDNKAAELFINAVDGDHFTEVAVIRAPE